MDDGNVRRTGVVFGVAAGGLLLGHWLTYLVDAPARHAQAMAATGHGYLETAAQLAAIVAAVCLATVFLGRLTRRDAAPALGATAARLAVVQGSAFVAMEVLERLGAGATLHDLTSILPLGLLVQSLVAFAGASLLRIVASAADVAARMTDSPGPAGPRAALTVVGPSFIAKSRPLVVSVAPRGPPSPS